MKVKSRNRNNKEKKMRISFDLDEVLFVSPMTHKTEPELHFPLNKIYKEHLRLGTPELINGLQKQGFEVWVYTSSFRSERYIRNLFKHYNVRFDDIINGERHMKEVQRDRVMPMPSKAPNYYHISLHIDDENSVISNGKSYGFKVLQIYEQDDDWATKINDKALEIRRNEALIAKSKIQE